MSDDILIVTPDDFACRCGPEETARCDAVMAWAMDFLSGGNEELRPADVHPGNFVTHAVYTLNWLFKANVDGIPNDMWSVILVSGFGEHADFHTYMQCDQIEDGFAFTLKAWYDKYGAKR